MADIDLKTETPDTTLPTTGFLFGADSQAAASPSVYSTQTVATTLLGSTSLTGATITADAPVLNLSQTWNAGGVTFTGLKFNATDTASAAASLLMDLQVGGSSRFNVGKTGSLKLGVSPTGTNQAGTDVTIAGSQGTGTGAGGSIIFQVAPAGSSGTAQNALVDALTIGGDGNTFTFRNAAIVIGGASTISINSSINLSSRFYVSGGPDGGRFSSISGLHWTAGSSTNPPDLSIYRDAANTLALRNGANAQAFRVYNTYTDANNYERLGISWSSDVAEIGVGVGGTGTPRLLRFTSAITASTASWEFRSSTLQQPRFVIAGTDRSVILTTNGNANGLSITNGLLTINRDNSAAVELRSSNNVTIYAILTADSGETNTLALRNGANAQEQRVYASYTSDTNFQRMSIKTLRESSGALSGASYTTTIAIPAYANLIGVTTRVTTEVTGATTYDVGDGTDVDLWGAAIGVALGSQSRTADFTAVGAVGAAAASRTVTLTANGSNFTGGVVEICLHYLTTEAD